MSELLVSISLHSLEEVDHKVLLSLAKDLLLLICLFHHFVLVSESLEQLQLVCQVLEVGCAIVVLGGKGLVFHVSVLDELLRRCELGVASSVLPNQVVS